MTREELDLARAKERAITDHTTLIAELRENAEWARAELRQSQAELFDRAADALERTKKPRHPKAAGP